MAFGLKLCSQLLVVVDLAIEYHHYATRIVGHGLSSAGNVANCQSAKAEMDVGGCIEIKTVRIGTAVLHCLRHRGNVSASAQSGKTRYSAHQFFSLPKFISSRTE